MTLSPLSSHVVSQATPTAHSPMGNLSTGTHAVPDVLVMASSSGLGHCWDRLVECLKALWKSIAACFGAKNTSVSAFSSMAPLVINPSEHPHRLTNPNKIFVYNQLVGNRSVGNPVTVQTLGLNDPHSLDPLEAFPAHRPTFGLINGPFLYDASTAQTVHWTANFADSHLFGFCDGPLLAQDELQVLEHPALAHVKNALPAGQRILRPYEAALFQNVPRLGALDTTTPLANHQTLYGNNFSRATQQDIQSHLVRFENPVLSNIFAIAAPHIASNLVGQPYQKRDLESLFYTFYNASKGMKETCLGKRVVVHTGNWGAGAFGNDPKTVHLIQLAAARCAGIDEIRMYPMSNQAELLAARLLLNQIEQQNPQMTIGQLLDHLTTHAATYGLTYQAGNGT